MNKLADKLFANPTKFNLKLLQKLLDVTIPFNIPHKFQLTHLNNSECHATLPFKRKNKNHLGGVHACAMATIGEFCAGVLIIKNFGMKKYRIIMSDLSVEYKYQGRTNLNAKCVNSFDDTLIKQSLNETGKYIQKLETNLFDEKNNLVATVSTTWQLKDWKKVKTV